MSHLDEGTLHALLDGELGATEVAEINAHLNGCTACTQRHREAREFRAEADRLIESVELAETQAPRGPAAVVETPMAPAPRAVEPPVVERPIREPAREPLREAAPATRPPEPRRATPPTPGAVPPSPRPAPPRPEPRPEPVPVAARSHEPPRAAPQPPRPRPVPEPEAARPEPWNAPPPPLLMPDNESRTERRYRLIRRLGVAATILVVAGTAALAYKLRPGTPPVMRDDTLNTMAGPTGVVSSLERSGAPSPATQKVDTVPDVPAPSVPSSAADEAQRPPSRQPTALANAPRAEAPPKPKPATAKQQAPAAEEAPASLGSTQDSLPEALASDTGAADSTATPDLADVRRRAAEAMQELDRDRRRDQAAAATAALDAARRRNARAPAPAAAAPPPAPPTIEQRAGIYLRIGLDEASRQLGGPAHVIEGMSASFMGLAPGGVDPGADSTRPLVRVVYQDSQGRLILLDQQRLRAGQAPPQGPLAWVAGEIALWLRGEAPADALRTLRSRVR